MPEQSAYLPRHLANILDSCTPQLSMNTRRHPPPLHHSKGFPLPKGTMLFSQACTKVFLLAKMGHPFQGIRACMDFLASSCVSTAPGSKVMVLQGLLGPEGCLSPGAKALKGRHWCQFLLCVSSVLVRAKGSGFYLVYSIKFIGHVDEGNYYGDEIAGEF